MNPTNASPQSARPARPPVDLSNLGQRLRDIPRTSGSADQAIHEIVTLVHQLTGAFGVAYFSRSDQARLTIRNGHCVPAQLPQLDSLTQQMLRLSLVACSEQQLEIGRPEPESPLLVVSVPIGIDPDQSEALTVVASVEEAKARQAVSLLGQTLQLMAAYLSQWRQQVNNADAVAEVGQLNRLLRILENTAKPSSFHEGSHRLAEGLRELYGCQAVALGIRRSCHKSCKLVAFSGRERFDRQSEFVQSIENVMDEALLQLHDTDNLSMAPRATSETAAIELLKKCANSAAVLPQPLRDASGKPLGAQLLFVERSDRTDSLRTLIDQTDQFTGTLLSLLYRARPSRLKWAWRAASHERGIFRQPVFWLGCASIFAMLLLPMPYRVDCDCETQPVTRRYVTVPYDGRLDTALIEPGDVVEQGQTLARMDGREIRWELGTLEADLKRAEKDHDSAMADHNTAMAQMADLEAQRLKLKIQLLQERLKNLEIKSPVSGIVIGGDPKKMEGARLPMGQTMLEVGPLENMLVELHVHDEDIPHVEVGQAISFRLAAHPYRKYEAQVDHIHPRSQKYESDNVFVAEARITNRDKSLRPGMAGQAKITTRRHMLGWNLFHKAWESLLFRFGW